MGGLRPCLPGARATAAPAKDTPATLWCHHWVGPGRSPQRRALPFRLSGDNRPPRSALGCGVQARNGSPRPGCASSDGVMLTLKVFVFSENNDQNKPEVFWGFSSFNSASFRRSTSLFSVLAQ